MDLRSVLVLYVQQHLQKYFCKLLFSPVFHLVGCFCNYFVETCLYGLFRDGFCKMIYCVAGISVFTLVICVAVRWIAFLS